RLRVSASKPGAAGRLGPAMALELDGSPVVTAYALATAVRAVYDAPTRDAIAFDRIVALGSAGYVACTGSEAILALRGVDDAEDWIDSLRYQQSDGYGGRVHRGFDGALDDLWGTLFPAVAELAAGRRLWLAGHSMGGALAVLAAWRLAEAGQAEHETYTFGAPRALDPVAAAAFPGKVFRFVNSRDVVPLLPTSGPWHRFAHVGEQMLLLPGGGLGFGTRRWMVAARRLLSPSRARWVRRLFKGSLDDHKMERYLANLSATIDLGLA
ncbi:MAG: lipase family protein, partial [Planctomycetota bacterium]|nr:lipase family protein [Planctomycetota bacterium]